MYLHAQKLGDPLDLSRPVQLSTLQLNNLEIILHTIYSSMCMGWQDFILNPSCHTDRPEIDLSNINSLTSNKKDLELEP